MVLKADDKRQNSTSQLMVLLFTKNNWPRTPKWISLVSILGKLKTTQTTLAAPVVGGVVGTVIAAKKRSKN